MPITGFYDGHTVQVDTPLRLNQRVIIIPIEDVPQVATAAGGLKKYADPSLIEKERGAWRKAAMAKHE